MRILVCNREIAENIEIPERHIMISISGPGDLAKLPENPRRMDLLRLEFYDLSSPLEGYQIFTEDMAAKVWRFVKQYAVDKNILIVVHCDAGLSRSPAIAAAIAKHYFGNDSHFFNRYLPNSLVYRIMLNVINGQRRQE